MNSRLTPLRVEFWAAGGDLGYNGAKVASFDAGGGGEGARVGLRAEMNVSEERRTFHAWDRRSMLRDVRKSVRP